MKIVLFLLELATFIVGEKRVGAIEHCILGSS
jgi:hypothetical protein